MGPICARQAAAVVANVEQVLALEVLCATQGLDFRLRTGQRPGTGVAAAYALVRESVDHLGADRDPQPDIAAALELVRSGLIAGILSSAPPAAGSTSDEGLRH